MKGPVSFPPVWMMLEDIPAKDVAIAKHLGCTVKTLRRYRDTGNAPRAVLLALFWETKWGRSAADTDSFNRANYMQDLARSLNDLVAELRRQIQQLENERTQDIRFAANLPIFRIA